MKAWTERMRDVRPAYTVLKGKPRCPMNINGPKRTNLRRGVLGGLMTSNAGNAAKKKHSAVAKSGRKSRKRPSIAT